MRPCLRASYPYGVSSRPCGERTKPCLLTANSCGDLSCPRLRRPGSCEGRTSPRALQSCPDEYSSSPWRRRTNPYGFTKVSSWVQGIHMYHAAMQVQVDDGPPIEGMTMTPGTLHGPCEPQLGVAIHALSVIASPLRARQSSPKRNAGCRGVAGGAGWFRWIAASGLCPSSQ